MNTATYRVGWRFANGSWKAICSGPDRAEVLAELRRRVGPTAAIKLLPIGVRPQGKPSGQRVKFLNNRDRAALGMKQKRLVRFSPETEIEMQLARNQRFIDKLERESIKALAEELVAEADE